MNNNDWFSQFGGHQIEENIVKNENSSEDWFSQFGGEEIKNITTPPSPSPVPESQGQDYSNFQGEDSVGRFAARTAKSAVSGALGGIADTATSLYNLPAAAFNFLKERLKGEDPRVLASMGLGDFIGLEDRESPDIPLIPSATHGIEKGLDNVTEGYTAIPENEKPIQAGIRSGAAFAAGGGLASGAGKLGLSGVQKASNLIGSTSPRAITGAAAVGGVSEASRESGDSELAALGKGALTGAIVETALSGNPARALVKLSGAGKKSLDTKSIDAANRIGVDLPLAAVSSAQAPNAVHQILSRIPGSGDYLALHADRASSKFVDSFENLLNKIGPKVENKEEFSQMASEIYKEFRKNIPEDAFVSPLPVIEKVDFVRKELKSLGSDSEATKEVLNTAKELEQGIKKGAPNLPEFLENAPQNIKSQLNNKKTEEVNLKFLLRQNIEINKKMRNKNIFNRSDTDSLDYMRVLKEGVENAIEQIAPKYPKLYELYKSSQREFSRLAKREEAETLLRDRINPPVSPKTPNYNALANILSNETKKQPLRNIFGENYDELKDFAEVARAFESIKRNNKNPSGSGWISLITPVATGVGSRYLPKTTAVTFAGIGGLTALSTSKRFINLANRYAKNPTPALSNKLETVIKDVTGASARELGMQVYDALKEEKID